MLRNASVLVARGGARVRIAGLEDLEESEARRPRRRHGRLRRREHARVLLCHHPDVVDVLPPGRFHLVLSGHSHGGQIVLPARGLAGAALDAAAHRAADYPLPAAGCST